MVSALDSIKTSTSITIQPASGDGCFVPTLLGSATSPVHPEAPAIQAASIDWARRLGLVRPEVIAKLDGQRIAWLAARCFPLGQRGAVEVVAKWLTLHCILDDAVEEASEGDLRALVAAVQDAFQPSGAALERRREHAIAVAAEDLRGQLRSMMDRDRYHAFLAAVVRLLASFPEECDLRSGARPVRLEDVLAFRDVNVGVEPLLRLIAPVHGVVAPGAGARSTEQIRLLEHAVCRLGALANDILTCEDEQSSARAINSVLFLANLEGCGWRAARRKMVEVHNRELASFLARCDVASSDSSGNGDTRRHVQTLRYFVQGHLDWAHQSARHRPVAVPSS